MSVSHFFLKYNTFNESICNGFYRLQQREEFVDMTLAADGYFVKVHQNVIALASPYLKSLLRSAPCQHPVIFLNNVNYETLSYILEYIYTGEVQVAVDKIHLFMDAATALHIIGINGTMLPKDNVNGINTPDKCQYKPDTIQNKFIKCDGKSGDIQDVWDITETPCVTSDLNHTKEATANINSDITLNSTVNTRSNDSYKILNLMSSTTDLNQTTASGIHTVAPTEDTEMIDLGPMPTTDLKSIVNASSLSLNSNQTLNLVSPTTDLNQNTTMGLNSVTSTAYTTDMLHLAPKPITNLNLYPTLTLDPAPSTSNTMLIPNLTQSARNPNPILILNPIMTTDSLNSKLLTSLNPREKVLNPNATITTKPISQNGVAASITINGTETDDYELEVQRFNENDEPDHGPEISDYTTNQDINNSLNKEEVSSIPRYTISNRDSLQLILNGYVYSAHHMSDGGRNRRWRCVDYRKLRCPVFIDTIDEIITSRKHVHSHPCHDKRIMTKLRRKKVYTSIKHAIEAVKEGNYEIKDEEMIVSHHLQ